MDVLTRKPHQQGGLMMNLKKVLSQMVLTTLYKDSLLSLITNLESGIILENFQAAK